MPPSLSPRVHAACGGDTHNRDGGGGNTATEDGRWWPMLGPRSTAEEGLLRARGERKPPRPPMVGLLA